jgi:hypothetical protein
LLIAGNRRLTLTPFARLVWVVGWRATGKGCGAGKNGHEAAWRARAATKEPTENRPPPTPGFFRWNVLFLLRTFADVLEMSHHAGECRMGLTHHAGECRMGLTHNLPFADVCFFRN